MNTARRINIGFGTQTAAVTAGGYSAPTGHTNIVESWNGTSWTTVTSMSTNRSGGGGVGIQTSGLAFGGYNGSAYTNASESYNGTSWTATNSMATARQNLAVGPTGI